MECKLSCTPAFYFIVFCIFEMILIRKSECPTILRGTKFVQPCQGHGSLLTPLRTVRRLVHCSDHFKQPEPSLDRYGDITLLLTRKVQEWV